VACDILDLARSAKAGVKKASIAATARTTAISLRMSSSVQWTILPTQQDKPKDALFHQPNMKLP
jgi:hypothetical protein